MRILDISVDDIIELIIYKSYDVFKKLYHTFIGDEYSDEMITDFNPKTFSDYYLFKQVIELNDFANCSKRIRMMNAKLDANLKSKSLNSVTGYREIHDILIRYKCDINTDGFITEVKARTDGLTENIPYEDSLRMNLYMFLRNAKKCVLVEHINPTLLRVDDAFVIDNPTSSYVEYDQNYINYTIDVLIKLVKKLREISRNHITHEYTIRRHFNELLEYIDSF